MKKGEREERGEEVWREDVGEEVEYMIGVRWGGTGKIGERGG